MTGTALFFYLFAGVCVASAFMVVAARNPVHSVLFLILAFVNAAGLFVLMGAEFLAMILVVVYVGAVAVLFLFVVMMLDVDFAELRQGALNYLPFGALIGIIFLVELVLVLGAWVIGPAATRAIVSPIPPIASVPNTEALGLVLYTRYIYFFQGRGYKGRAMTIGLGHYLTVAAILFTLGVFGIFLNRKNVIIILMSIELILLAGNINLVAFSTYLGDLVGQIFALLVLTVAAAEAAIGLAILVVFYRNRGSIGVEDINLMKG
jgi:NADH-quinone oxidoreductase subunit J